MMTEHKHTIAIDFDGCLCENDYPEIGSPNWSVIKEAVRMKERGHQLILWTHREGELLTAALEACRSWGLEFEYANENSSEMKKWYGDCRKISAHEYWDSSAVYMGDAPFRDLHGINVVMPGKSRTTQERVRWRIADIYQNEIDHLEGLGNIYDPNDDEIGRELFTAKICMTDMLEYLELLLTEKDELCMKLAKAEAGQSGSIHQNTKTQEDEIS